jgi:hypothetical protein
MKLIGILLILNGIVVASWWITTQGSHTGAILLLSFLAVFAGLALVLQDRITELTVKGVGTIKAAAERARSDADGIEDIRKRVETQAATMDLVAKESAEAKTLLNNLSEQNKIAEDKLVALTELAAPPRLSFQEMNITKTDSGYDAAMTFTPSKNRPLGALVFSATIQGESKARILDFWPVRGMFQTGDDPKRISKDGRRAHLQYQLMGVGRPSIILKTSAPATIKIEGNHYLQAFLIEIK